jgi:protein ImuB
MPKRFISIWFRHLKTDWVVRRRQELGDTAFVMAAPERGRMVVKAVSRVAHAKGIHTGMVVADCRAVFPGLQVLDDKPGLSEKLLNALAEWCLRYTPVIAIDPPDGLILDVSGCPHLWGGERPYLKDIIIKLRGFGYDVRAAIADTVGAAWAVSRYGQVTPLIEPDRQIEAIMSLPPVALRLDAALSQRLAKLGLNSIGSFMNMPRTALRRRFGQTLLDRIDEAVGQKQEVIRPICPVEPYQERLPCLEPIRTKTGIEIALENLLEKLCKRLEKEAKGLRACVFKAYRVDGEIQQLKIGTNRATRNVKHLIKLFENKTGCLIPALGFEVFVIEAPIVEDAPATQEAFWATSSHDDMEVMELLDRIGGKVGMNTIHRYLPDEHYWPERSLKIAGSFEEKETTPWRTDLPRPVHLLPKPELIEVSVPMPDYPPLLFIYKGQLHNIKKADGPERIEQEWWIENGLYRDYYCVEDESGRRYWLFRSGSYDTCDPKWFIHGFFA